MKHKKNKNRFLRYLKVSRRKLNALTFPKALRWLKKNLKSHPFILGLMCLVGINIMFFSRWDIKALLLSLLLIFISWLILVSLSNSLKDKNKVKWYFKKRFVFFMLVFLTPLFLTPLALVFLWSGAQFKRITKIVLTVIFSFLFVLNYTGYLKRYEKRMHKTSLETTIDLITGQKKEIFLKSLGPDALKSLRLAKISPRLRKKLAASDISARCSPAVASVKTQDKDGNEIGQGSGFVISADGYIVTNFHVLASSYQAEVKIGEQVFKDASLVKAAKNLDIAILKVNGKNLPILPVGDSDSLVSGQFLIAMGSPWGFEHSVSSGIVSAIRTNADMKLIQMTAPVSPGSSGGPVINEYGEAVAITTIASLFVAQNLNFAVPINYLNRVITEK